MLKTYLSRKFTSSSYYADNYECVSGITTTSSWFPSFVPGTNPKLEIHSRFSHAVIYAFSDDPVGAANSGISSGSFRFQGSEQLILNFDQILTEGVSVDVYAYVESVIEISPTYVKKINL
jgi:hypothetical protein